MISTFVFALPSSLFFFLQIPLFHHMLMVLEDKNILNSIYFLLHLPNYIVDNSKLMVFLLVLPVE